MNSNPGSSSTVLNKIIIPVITTVLGATAIYFLGFNKKSTGGRTDMEQMLLSKEATIKAWKSYVAAQNIGFSNATSLQEEYIKKFDEASRKGFEEYAATWKEYESEFLREDKKFQQDIEKIPEEKDIDRDFVSLVNRTLENGKDQRKKFTDFVDEMEELCRSNMDNEMKRTKLVAGFTRFDEKQKKDVERMITETEGIAKILAERYSQAFDLNQLDVYVHLKNEKNKKNPDVNPTITNPVSTNTGTANNNNNNNGGIAPPDPNTGTENTNTQSDNIPNTASQPSNQLQPTKSLLTGQWSMTGGTLELSANGDMFWVFDNKGYTSGDWRLENGKIRMNATNPDTRQTSLLIGYVSDFTRNSFTLTFMTTPREVYYMTRKK